MEIKISEEALRKAELNETQTIKRLIKNGVIVSPIPLCKLLIKSLSLDYVDKKWKLHLTDKFIKYFKETSTKLSASVSDVTRDTFREITPQLMMGERVLLKKINPKDLSTELISTYTKLSALDRIIEIIAADRKSLEPEMTFECQALESTVMENAPDKHLSFVIKEKSPEIDEVGEVRK